MMRKTPSLLSIIFGALTLPFLFVRLLSSSKKMDTKPRENDASGETQQRQPVEQTAPLIESVRPDEKRMKTENSTHDSHNKTNQWPKKRWTYKRKQTWFTGIVAAATIINVIGFIYSLREIRLSRELENRAWVNFQEFKLSKTVTEVQPEETFDTPATIINTGRTPALNVTAKYSRNFFYVEPDEFPPPETVAEKPQAIIPPIESPYPITFHAAPLNSAGKNYVLEKKLHFFIWGVVEYDDVFGNKRKTHFCFFSISHDKKDLFFCRKGNWVE